MLQLCGEHNGAFVYYRYMQCTYIQTFQYKTAILSYLTSTFIITDAMVPNGDGTSVILLAHMCPTDVYHSLIIYKRVCMKVPYYLILPI